MKIDRNKLDVILAEKGKNYSSLRGTISSQTQSRIRNNLYYDTTPKVVGKLAKELDCEIIDIVKTENKTG